MAWYGLPGGVRNWLLAWMREFSLKRDRPFFYELSGERFGFGPREFQVEMLAKLERGERLW